MSVRSRSESRSSGLAQHRRIIFASRAPPSGRVGKLRWSRRAKSTNSSGSLALTRLGAVGPVVFESGRLTVGQTRRLTRDSANKASNLVLAFRRMRTLKRFTAVAGSAMLLVTYGAFFSAASAAEGCTSPSVPSYGPHTIEYWGTARCTGSNVETFRAKIGVAYEEVNWGPIPNSWKTLSGSYSPYSSWAPRNGSRYLERGFFCLYSPYAQYKAKFWYQVDCICGSTEEFGMFSGETASKVCGA